MCLVVDDYYFAAGIDPPGYYFYGPVSTDAPDKLIIGDVITYFSIIGYFGNLFFQIQFTLYRIFQPLNLSELMYNTTSPQLEKSNSTVSATVMFYQIASCPSYQHTRLIVEFQQPIVDLLPGSATNNINESFSIDIDPVSVSCEYLQTFQSLVSQSRSELVAPKRNIISLHQLPVPCYEVADFKSQMDSVGVYILKL